MRKDKSGTHEPKAKYRVRNWAAYNAGLINRGNVTIWIDDNTLANMPDTEPTRGRPRQYSDALIQALLGLKAVFHLPLRALQGFAQSLRDLAFAELPVPNYSTVCRRAQTLQVKLPAIHSGEPLHLVVDSAGAKVYGEGEWESSPAWLLEASHLAQGPSRTRREHRIVACGAHDASGCRG